MPVSHKDDKVADGAKRALTQEHKDAMALGRRQGRIVGDYLDRLRDTKPRRGRKRTPESIQKRLDAIEAELPNASMLKAISLIQERERLTTELGSLQDTQSLSDLEKEFVEVAKDYAERKGISAKTFREVGVPPDVLKRAGIE